jgi:hypothetical protein
MRFRLADRIAAASSALCHRNSISSKVYMARRRSSRRRGIKIPGSVVLLVIIMGVATGIGPAVKSTEASGAIGIYWGIGAATAVAAAIFLIALSIDRWHHRAVRGLFEQTELVTSRHIQSLVRRRAQTHRHDDYGNVLDQEWLKEIDYFIKRVLVPALPESDHSLLGRYRNEIVRMIVGRVEAASATNPAEMQFNSAMAPADYEHFCADQIRQGGWSAKVTKASGDQGVDVVAEKAGVRVVLQCKLYGQAVGNKAVQEVFAAKIYERAHHAAVITNARYTASAKKLAATNGVFLLHHADLIDFDHILKNRPVDA